MLPEKTAFFVLIISFAIFEISWSNLYTYEFAIITVFVNSIRQMLYLSIIIYFYVFEVSLR